jgi:hypothetical protein
MHLLLFPIVFVAFLIIFAAVFTFAVFSIFAGLVRQHFRHGRGTNGIMPIDLDETDLSRQTGHGLGHQLQAQHPQHSLSDQSPFQHQQHAVSHHHHRHHDASQHHHHHDMTPPPSPGFDAGGGHHHGGGFDGGGHHHH